MPLIQKQQDKLIKKTVAHWEKCQDDRYSRPACAESYVNRLLPQEIAAARTEPGQLPPAGTKLNLLVLMLGYSYEPLLQSIIAYWPDRVL